MIVESESKKSTFGSLSSFNPKKLKIELQRHLLI